MRDKVIAASAVAVAGVAVVVGLTIGALGGAFDNSGATVPPPVLRSDLSNAVSATTSPAIVVPPSPTWQVAVPTTPKATTTTKAPTTAPSTTKSTTRRGSATTSERPETESDSESESESESSETTTTP